MYIAVLHAVETGLLKALLSVLYGVDSTVMPTVHLANAKIQP